VFQEAYFKLRALLAGSKPSTCMLQSQECNIKWKSKT